MQSSGRGFGLSNSRGDTLPDVNETVSSELEISIGWRALLDLFTDGNSLTLSQLPRDVLTSNRRDPDPRAMYCMDLPCPELVSGRAPSLATDVLALRASDCRFNDAIASWLTVTGRKVLSPSSYSPATVLILLLYGLPIFLRSLRTPGSLHSNNTVRGRHGCFNTLIMGAGLIFSLFRG